MMRLIKLGMYFFSALSLVLGPLAEAKGKENQQKEYVEQYLKNTGISTKSQTFGEFWRSVRYVYPQEMRTPLDAWILRNHEQVMPQAEVTNFSDADGVEQVRVLLHRDGQSVTLTFTGNEDFPVKVNGVKLSKKELESYDLDHIAKRLTTEDSSIRKSAEGPITPINHATNGVLSFKAFSALTPEQKGEYLIRVRLAMQSAAQVYEKFNGKGALNEINQRHPWVRSFFFGEYATALDVQPGAPCLVAGFLSVYSEKGSCGGPSTGSQDFSAKAKKYQASCPGQSSPCNPLVYGYDNGNAFCVQRGQIINATAECNRLSPLSDANDVANKKRIIESYLSKRGKNIDLKFNEEGKVSQEQYKEVSQYLGDLTEYLKGAQAHCEAQKTIRGDQKDACDALNARFIALEAFVVSPAPPFGDLPPGDKDCNAQIEGSILAADNTTCQCPEGKDEQTLHGKKVCVVIGGLAGGAGKDGCTSFICKNKGWLIAGAALLAVGGVAWWLLSKNKKSDDKKDKDKKDKDKDKDKDKPKPKPVPTPIHKPVCRWPRVMLRGVCQKPPVRNPPVVVPPPSEGGTTVDVPDAGGLRKGGAN